MRKEQNSSHIRAVSLALLVAFICASLFGCKKKEPTESHITSDSEFVFVAQEVKEVPVEQPPAKQKKSVTFVISDKVLYEVSLPKDLEVLTNYATFVYAFDGSVTISVVSGVDESNFSTGVVIKTPEYISPVLIKSKEGAKGPQECAIFIEGGKAVVARCYNNPVAFATIFEGMQRITWREPTVLDGVGYKKDVSETLNSLPKYTGNYENTITVGVDYSEPKQYYFDDGFLMIAQELRQFTASKDYNNLRIAAASGIHIINRTYEEEGKVYWVECDDFFVCVIQDNFNTSRTFFGRGMEAKVNMSDYLSTL